MPRSVQTAPVVREMVERTVSATGALLAQEQAVLSVKVQGRLAQVLVDLGSNVEKGDPVCVIEQIDYDIKVKQADAALAQARARAGLQPGQEESASVENSSVVLEARALLDEALKSKDRISKLAQQKVLSQSEQETVEAAYSVASSKYQEAVQEARNRLAILAQRKAELEMARQQLADTVIRAPFKGVVQERRASPGEFHLAGDAAVMLVSIDPIRLRLEISERDSPRVRKGQKVTFRIEGEKKTWTTEIHRVSPTVNQETRMLWVESDVPNDGRLRPGSFVRAEVVVDDQSPAVLVAKSALSTFAGIEKLVLLKDGKALETLVKSGGFFGDQIEILKGAEPGMVAVLNPGSLRTGEALVTATK